MHCSFVTTDRSTFRRIAAVGWSERYDKNAPFDLGDHQPMRRRDRRVEQRIGFPNLVDVVDAERNMLEQMCSFVVDLERMVSSSRSRSNSSATSRVYYIRMQSNTGFARRPEPTTPAGERDHGEEEGPFPTIASWR